MFNGVKHQVAHVAHYCSGAHTVLGEVSDAKEVFPILECENVCLSEIVEKVTVAHWPGKRIKYMIEGSSINDVTNFLAPFVAFLVLRN